MQNIPVEFAMKIKYLLGVSEIVKLQVSDGREWCVRFIHACGHGGHGSKISKGWITFVKENNLVEGDICVFELVEVKDVVLKVSIFHIAEYAGQPNLPHEFDERKYSKNTNQRTVSRGPVKNEAREREINAATMFKPENHFHRVILHSYNHSFLNIPSEFGMRMKYLLGVSDINMVKLQLSDGREWYARCIHDKLGRQAKLTMGWGTFVRENNLVEGDTCVFELNKAKDFVLKVSIFRTVAYAGQAKQPLE
ncbi:B3 domain-containing protein REM19-like [Cornus florida]|uniref:B3 domain-containing protein REM19-like n=1 Tax=Cornus florida TaxID=4283 RepID=UPI00289DE08B|nr:B3 domain-containing protein REM19-like [Cornus florida]